MCKRILLIEDEADIREVAQISLETVAGWDVLTASSGSEGVELARNESPDGILLDVMMPGMDGPATLKKLQEDPATSEIPLAFLTAKVQSSEKRQLLGMGARGIIPKPFDPVALAGQVRELFGWNKP